MSKNIKVRPHWAKEVPVDAGGRSSSEYLQEVYGDQIGNVAKKYVINIESDNMNANPFLDMFLERYESIVTSRGGSVDSSRRRFSTKYFDQVRNKKGILSLTGPWRLLKTCLF